MLQLQVKPRTYSKWLADQQVQWRSSLASLRLPTIQLVATVESRKRRMKDVSEQERALLLEKEFVLPEWSAGVPGLLALLLRWSEQLHPPSDRAATVLLEGFLAKALPQGTMAWQCSAAGFEESRSNTYPAKVEDEGVLVNVVRQSALLSDLLKLPAVAAAGRRSA